MQSTSPIARIKQPDTSQLVPSCSFARRLPDRSTSSHHPNLITIFATGVGILFAGVTPLHSAVLIGSGPHVPVPNTPPPPSETRTITSTTSGFSGTWSSAVAPQWSTGSFTVTGSLPAGAASTGVAEYDFSGLGTSGVLPIGTYFRFGDLDNGSQASEVISFRAWNSSGTLITDPWLNTPIGGTGNIVPLGLPEWNFDGQDGSYVFDGKTAGGVQTFGGFGLFYNPQLGFTIENNTPIARLEVTRDTIYAGFSLGAPVPEPGSLALILTGLALSLRRSRSRPPSGSDGASGWQ